MAGEKLSSKSAPLSNKSFSGGLNSTGNPINLEANESPDCLNVDFDKFGSVLKRNGYTCLNTTAFNSGAAWTSLHWFQVSTGDKFLIGTCGNKFGTWSALTGSPTDSTGAVTITGSAPNNLWQWETFLDTALGVNGADAPIKWTGSGNASAWTMPTNVTIPKWVKVFNNYVFIANLSLSGVKKSSRLHWTDLRAITFDDANFSDISKDDGQEITGMGVLGDRVVIFKEFSIWIGLFTGDVDIPFNFTKTSSEVGCINGHSIQNALNGLLFQAQDGLYFFDGNGSYKLSYRIQNTLNTMNKTRFQYGSSIYQYEKNRYMLSMSSGSSSTHNRDIIYDTFNNSFSTYQGRTPNCFARVMSSGSEYIYFGDYSGYVYLADSGSDDYPANVATAITSYYYTKWFDEGDILNQKGDPEIVLYYDYNSSTLSLNYSFDLSNSDDYILTFNTAQSGTLIWGTGLWNAGTWAGTGGSFRRLDLDGRGRLIRFKISNSNLGETYKINGLGKLVHMETNV